MRKMLLALSLLAASCAPDLAFAHREPVCHFVTDPEEFIASAITAEKAGDVHLIGEDAEAFGEAADWKGVNVIAAFLKENDTLLVAIAELPDNTFQECFRTVDDMGSVVRAFFGTGI